jgi:uncharacterized RDD family membrane protein YckC
MKEGGAQIYWVRRVIAFAIDALIVYFAVGLLVILVAASFLVLSVPGVFVAVLVGVFSFLAGIILVMYFVAFEVLAGASVGKRFMGLKVIASGDRAPNLAEALVRNVSKLYWLLLILDVIVGLAVSKSYAQKYTDKLMNTSVVGA